MKLKSFLLSITISLFLIFLSSTSCNIEPKNELQELPEGFQKIIGLWEYNSYQVDAENQKVYTRKHYIHFLGTSSFDYWYSDSNDSFSASYLFNGSYYVDEKNKTISANVKKIISLDRTTSLDAEGILLSMIFSCTLPSININNYNLSFLKPIDLGSNDSDKNASCNLDPIIATSLKGNIDKDLLFPDSKEIIVTGNLPENSQNLGIMVFLHKSDSISEIDNKYKISLQDSILGINFSTPTLNNTFSTSIYLNESSFENDDSISMDAVVYIDNDNNWDYDSDYNGMPITDSYLFSFKDPVNDAVSISSSDSSATLITVGDPINKNVLDILSMSEPLKINYIDPIDSETGVDINIDIELTFSTNVDSSTIDFQTNDGSCSGNIQFMLEGNSSCLGIISINSNDDKTFIIKLNNVLQAGKTYKISAFQSIKSDRGENLDKDYWSTFTTSL